MGGGGRFTSYDGGGGGGGDGGGGGLEIDGTWTTILAAILVSGRVCKMAQNLLISAFFVASIL